MIKLALTLSFFILFTNTTSSAGETKAGRSPYAIQNTNYSCESLLHSISSESNFRYSWLYNTFNNSEGDGLECVKKLNSLGNTSYMQVHLINEVCQRNKNCGAYELLHGLNTKQYRIGLSNKDPEIINRVEAYIQKAAEEILPTLKPNITCAVSTGLESNLSREAALVILEITKKHFGDRCKLVWNPVGNNKFGIAPIENTIHELHGPHPKIKPPCISNLDGIDIDLPHRKSFNRLGAISLKETAKYLKDYNKCEASFVWIAEDNCLQKGNFIDPRKRSNCTSDAENKILNGLIE